MRIDWSPLDAAMEARTATFWWRDDDAVAPTPALDRLLNLAAEVSAPLTLATIPARTTDRLARRTMALDVRVAVHGWAHTNHAPDSEKKAEFGPHRPLEDRLAEAERGLTRLRAEFASAALPVFIPPWNRLAPDMPEWLPAAGFEGLSVYGEEAPRAEPLPRFDSHLDPIDWRGTRSAVDPARIVERAAALVGAGHPVGLMTHHLVHDDAIWALTEALVRHVTERGCRWTSLTRLVAGRAAR